MFATIDEKTVEFEEKAYMVCIKGIETKTNIDEEVEESD